MMAKHVRAGDCRRSLSDKMEWLARLGCYPSIYLRGDVWRAHINMSGNQWDEGPTAFAALDKAIRQWNASGRPMDGYAATTPQDNTERA